MKNYLIIFSHSPYINSESLEGFELALALAAFEQNVSLLFMGDGVLQLLPNQNPELINQKNFTKAFAGLDLFEINPLYIEQDAANTYGITKLMPQLESNLVDVHKINSIIAAHDFVINI